MGFIDTLGNTVIPFRYSIRPGSFYNNRAAVFPSDQNMGFDYGYIDKKGELIIQIKKRDWDFHNFSPYNINFHNGNAIVSRLFYDRNKSYLHFIDTAGTEHAVLISHWENIVGMHDNYIIHKVQDTKGYTRLGMIDIFGNIVLSPAYEELGYFDEVSGLAKAKYEPNQNEYREGFINKSGVFVLVKKPLEKW
jgi:hypothetical protein